LSGVPTSRSLGCMGLSLAYYIHDLNPFLIRFSETWGIRWYGVAYLAAFLVGYWLYKVLVRRGFSDLRPDQVGDFIFGTALFGVVLGGRLGYMLFYDWGGFLADPLIFFRFHEGGMSAHGGILGVALYSLWFARRHKVSWLNLGDNLVVVAPVGLFFGRMANFINGELYGRVTSAAWAVQFPKELYDAPPEMRSLAFREASALNPDWNTVEAVVEAARTSPELQNQLAFTLSPRHPSQIYEAMLEGALLFAILWLMRTRMKIRDGILTGAFFVGYAVFRSFCEIFREPDAPLVGALTRGQFLSIGIAVLGVLFWVAAARQPERSPKKNSP
jgi:phosphatidylglycerol---prolipoprotein diacylglyceryl transferase